MTENNKQEKKGLVDQLKAEGNRVDVYHARRFCNNTLSTMMSRKEFTEKCNESPEFSSLELDNRSGYTHIRITTPDGKVGEGKYNVKRGCQFNRKIGIQAAAGRALKSLK